MARSRLVLAGLAGLVLSFLLFVALQLATPDPELARGEGEVHWERFQFDKETESFTRDSIVRIVNDDPVPLELVVSPPSGGNGTLKIPAGEAWSFPLDEQGTYQIRAPAYPWAEAMLEVRSANPLTRLFEDLFGGAGAQR